MPSEQNPTLPTLAFGALAPLLADQLASLIVTDAQRNEVEHLDRDAQAVARLVVRGLIADSTAKKARDRIAKAAWEAVRHAS